jgi:ABC-type Zn uptake system ZnuABC Zn-binding protein ZnuA
LAVWGAGGDAPAQAAQRLRVITTSTDLKALAEEVGGDRVEVESLTRGFQNQHNVEGRASFMLKLSRADLFVRIGLNHEPWLDPILEGARNPRILRGAPGLVEGWQGMELLEIPPAGTDRSMGDIHAYGNTHIWLDPENAKIIVRNIAEGLKRVDPAHAAAYEQNWQRFVARIDTALPKWLQKLAPFRGAKIITYHTDLPYFVRRFGLVVAGYVEPKPGIPPSPAYVAELVQRIRGEKIPLLVVVSYYDDRLPKRIGEEAGAKVLIVPLSVGGAKGIDTYFALIDYLVNEVAAALAGTSPPKS